MYERMLNKAVRPTYEEMAEYCGKRKEEFTAFNHFLSDAMGTDSEIRFPYGNSYGWSVTHRYGKKLVCDVFAEADAFNVMLRLPSKTFDSAYPSLGEYARKCIDTKYPCGDGGWLHYRVIEQEQLEDIMRLATLKQKPGRLSVDQAPSL